MAKLYILALVWHFFVYFGNIWFALALTRAALSWSWPCYCVWEPSPSPRQHLSITRGLASSLTHSTPYSSWKTRFVYSTDIHPGKLDLSLIFNRYWSWKTQFVFNIQTKLPSSGQFWYSPYWFWKTRFVFVFIFILENSIRLWCSICVTTNTDYYAQTSISPKLTKTRSSWLNCALRGDKAVYWVSIGQQWWHSLGQTESLNPSTDLLT